MGLARYGARKVGRRASDSRIGNSAMGADPCLRTAANRQIVSGQT